MAIGKAGLTPQTGREANDFSASYLSRRQTAPVFKDGLARRARVVHDLLAQIFAGRPFRLLDVGTAEGSMLEWLQATYPDSVCQGVEKNAALVEAGQKRGLSVFEGDARKLPFADGTFEVVLLAATLKHIPQYRQVLEECTRVLEPGGHILVLDPTPLGLWVGLKMGHFDPRYLANRWSTQRTASELERSGFRIVQSRRYMLFPIKIPGAEWMETVLRTLGLSSIFLQQAVAGMKR